MAQTSGGLSDAEREELERLRARQAEIENADQERREREELERLRKAQKYAEEDAAYYAERAKRKAQREYEREHPDYSVDDLPPMPLKQKIVIGVLAVMVVVLIVYLVWFHGAR